MEADDERDFAALSAIFEGADPARLERSKTVMPGVIQELVFHPDARLASTWQPWDGVLAQGGAPFFRAEAAAPLPSS